ncbi:MAG: FkbM family methyltransferase [Proteobacteria bacterium]|nr:FkbM family methyltransferase [Burkholderiales bacterium]
MRNAVRSSLKALGLGITRYETLRALKAKEQSFDDIALLRTFPAHYTAPLVHILYKSKAQLRQDLFVLAQTDFKRNGYFVEFGATNGETLSNTHLLEKEFDWTGILAEPAQQWREALKRNRKAALEFDCVWKETGSKLTFNEVAEGEFSTIDSFSAGDRHRKIRRRGTTYQVNTISLNDLLEKHGAPALVDYLSIDTEGSEFEILSAFDFNRRKFRVITCEHNYTPMREELFQLLSRHGYYRVFPELSRFDDWYVLK